MVLLWIIAAVSFVSSVAGKLLADHLLSRPIFLIGSFVSLQYSTNAGVAFGITFPGWLQALLIAVAVTAVIILAFHTSHSRISSVAFGLIIGGALGNIVDRIGDGVVTDFMSVGTFPIFNVADSCITVGVCLLLIDALLKRRAR